MKKPVSKEDLRRALHEETHRFLQNGGEVEKIPTGLSGRNPDDPPLYLNQRLFAEPKSTRTPVSDVIAAIEARKQRPRRKPQRQRRLPRPRRKTIYDDFGEPLRRVWIDE